LKISGNTEFLKISQPYQKQRLTNHERTKNLLTVPSMLCRTGDHMTSWLARRRPAEHRYRTIHHTSQRLCHASEIVTYEARSINKLQTA